MYEENNNNNYTYEANYTPTEPQKPKNNGGRKAGKIFALILAVALIGGASGFGGALLANSMNSDNISATEVENEEAETEKETISTVTAAPQNSSNEDATLGNLLNVTPADGVLTTEQIIHNATPSVVLITSEFEDAQGSGTGTGIVLSADGYIITNCHVIETSYQTYQSTGDVNPFENPFSFFGGGYEAVTQTAQADKVTVTMSDGAEHEAEIIGSDENTDLALLKIDVEGLIPAVLGSSDDLTLGETAVTLGYPLGLGLSASEGIVSGLEKELTTELSNGG
ncbi:MAG: trypsin-like peptidase domain-containing protein, partial [Oscillospiraceae bacterium]|nr:trypsin-like peptidase domain-containing protein [Oscillospiraceae bacterium]